MGKICGLGYLDHRGSRITLTQDYCNHGWESFGEAQIFSNQSFRPFIQYDCSWALGCTVDFKFTYQSEGKVVWWRDVKVPWGKSWISPGALPTPTQDQWITVVAYENGNIEDQIFFRVKIFKPQPLLEKVGNPFISPSNPTTNDDITVYQRVKNAGTAPGYLTIIFSVDNKPVCTRRVYLDIGEVTTVSCRIGKLPAGTHRICVI